MQSKSDSNLWGIDVSHHQGSIDWPKVKAAGVQFAFVKASEGVGVIDSQFRRNAGGANAVGVPVGFYHYAHPELNSIASEVSSFLEAVNGQPCQLPYVLDLEGEAGNLGRQELTQWALGWMTEVKKRTGKPVMLYTGAYFARDEVGAELGAFPLWVAHYGANTPLHNSTWPSWSVFQYSDSGSCPGISGKVDMNLMEADFMSEVTNTKKTDFVDVPAGHWAEGVIAAVSKSGLMNGTGDGKFEPDRPITRAEVAKVVNDLIYMIANM